MEDKKEKPAPAEKAAPIAFPKGFDVLGSILNPPRPVRAAEFKQQATPRDKQFRGGKNK